MILSAAFLHALLMPLYASTEVGDRFDLTASQRCAVKRAIISGKKPVVSLIHLDDRLVRFAQNLRKRQGIQDTANALIDKYLNGNSNPGLGTTYYGGNIIELRHGNGARVFIKEKDKISFIIGKCDKGITGEQERLIKLLRTLYPEMSDEKGGFHGRRGSGN